MDYLVYSFSALSGQQVPLEPLPPHDQAVAARRGERYARIRTLLRQELSRRGVSRDLWDDALAEMPDSAETIEGLLQSRLRGRTPDRDEGRKLAAMLQRRGFTWQEIRGVLQRFLDGEDLPEE